MMDIVRFLGSDAGCTVQDKELTLDNFENLRWTLPMSGGQRLEGNIKREFAGCRLVRQQIENAPGRFTARDIFERVRFEPGIVLASVERALRRLRNAGEVVVADKNGASRPMV